MDEKKYCYCKVKIEGRRNSLYYLSEITDLKAEDTVEVPFGYENELMIGTVVSIEYYTKYEAPYPVENTKKIIGKVSSSNSDSDIRTDETGTILIKYVGEKKKLISFKVPDGIIEIAPKAFANAHSLSKIELPEGLKIIGDEAFKSTSIEKVKIPSTVEEIGKLAFPAYSYKHTRFDKNNKRFKTDSDCIYRINDDGTYIVIACWKKRLGKYKLDDNVKAIADNAFYNCTGLKEIVLNDKLEVIGNDVFCKNTITSIKLPENVKEINNLPLLKYEGKNYEEEKIDIEISPNNKHYTMEDKTLYKVLEDGTLELLLCSSKKDKIIVKDGTKIIKESSFKNKKNIKTILLPESLELIEESAFSGCNKLKTVTINNDKFGELENVIYLPSKIKEIKEFTFNLCGFTTIKFSDNIENIEKNTFLCCDRLKKMILPKNLKTFNNMFEDNYISNNLELIEVPKENELFCSVDGIVFDKNKETIIYVPDAYKCDCYEIPNTVKNIGKSFSYCKNIKKLVLNNQITNIEEKAFKKSSIEEFVIPNTLTHIGNKAFDLSYGIKSVKIYGDENSYIKTYLSKCTNIEIAFIFISQNTDLNTIELQTNYKYKVTPEGIIINKYLGKEKTVEIPDTIENKPVIEIGKEAFISNYELKKIAFPSSTKKIGNGAFKHCANLKKVIIPDSVEEIGEEAFYGQNKIIKIVLPKNLKKISRSMLDYCNVLTEIKIPESVTEIEGGAFFGCDNLIRMHIPKSVTKISEHLFSEAEEDRGQIVYKYKDLYLSNKQLIVVVEKDSYADNFIQEYIKNMDEFYKDNIKIVYDENVLKPLDNEIETRKYKYSENKNNKGTYEITGFTHRGSYNIVNFPNTINGLPVTKIAFDFSLKTGTDEIIIPENVEVIEKMPLVNTKITVSENNKYFSSDGYALYDKDKTKLYAVYVVDKKEYIIPDTVIEITENAFTWCEKLTKLHIPNSVKIIGDEAFNYCTKLKEITGGNNVISVGKEAFKETPWYKTNDILVLGKTLIKSNLLTKVVTIPNNVEIIGTESFAILDSCWNVDDKTEEIIIPETIKNIEAGAFKNRRKLERITLPQCLKTIPSNLFEDCSNLKEIVIPNNVKVIEKEAFERCTSLVNITLPDYLTEIKEEAFYQCKSLEQIIIPNSVTKIGESAFNECVNLKTINLPNTLKKISSSLFSSCKNLESINIPCNLETIGSYAFNSCEKIKEIILPDSLKVIEAAAFRGCLSIESIRIPKQVKGVYNYSFPDTVIYPYRLRKELNCSFKTIEVDEENPYYKSINGILYTKDLKTLVSVPAKWDKNTIFSIPQEVEKIEKYAIKNNRTIKKIIIPDSVKEISESAISECLNLEEVVLPKNLEKIPKYLLAGCSKLIRISWPDNLKEIGEAAFSGTGLKVINIPETVTTIDDYALSYTNANKITIPKSVKNIGLSICAGTSEIEVYDSIDDNAKPAKEYIDNCNGTPNSNVGWMGICKNKMYTVCAASPNTIWHNHTIIVKSKETDKIKYRVPMNGIDEARTYYCMLTSSWGKNAEFNFELLDKAFTKIKNMRYKIKLAISRLEDNYELTDGIRKMYESYLKKSGVKIVKYYIDINDLNTLKILEKYEVITKINIDKAIEYAQEKHNTTIVSYLKDYKNKII